MNPSRISSQSLIGKAARLPLKLIPKSSIIPILQGPARGMKWVVGSSDNGCWLGSYEQAIQDTFKRHVKPGQIVYDVGAHVGFYTLLSSALVGSDGHVYAFEPLPDNLGYLNRHIEINKLNNVTVIESAISDQDGILKFSTGTSSSQGCLDESGSLSVPTVTLDSLIKQGYPAPDLIKMDIEGAEMAALRGGSNLLQTSHPSIILATHSYELQQTCRDFLESINYTVKEISGPGADKGHLRDFFIEQPSS